MRALKWCSRHWYIPLILIGSLVLWHLGLRRHRKPIDVVRAEFDAIEAKKAARLAQLEKGRDMALAMVEADHRKTLDELGEHQKRRADRLRGDPGRLSAFLVRAASRQRAGGEKR